MRHAPLAICVCLSLVAIALAARPREAPAQAAPAAQPDARVAERLAALEASVEELAARPAPLAVTPAREPVGGASVDVEAVVQRLEALEARVDETRAVAERTAVELDGDERMRALLYGRPGGAPLDAAELAAITGVALDPGATEDARLEALRELRGQRTPAGEDARTPEVVQALVELARSSQDAEVREDVYRQMSGVVDPVLRDACLDALEGDASAGVREEAAETLMDFLPDPTVVAALEWAAANDESGEVKVQAFESLHEEDD